MNDRKDRIRVHIEGKEYHIEGGQFQAMLAAVKQINGRRFVSALKVWQLPGTAADIQHQLEISGFQLTGGDPVADAPETTPPASSVAPPAAGASARAGGDRIQLTVQGQPVTLVGGAFQEMLSAVKNLPNRRFDNLSRSWEIADDLAIVKVRLEEAGFRLEGAESGLVAPPPAMQPPRFAPITEPPPFETPDFFDSSDIPAYEPPDWWDDDQAPSPPAPPDWPEEEPTGFSPASAPVTAPSPRSGGDQVRIRIGGIPFLVSGGSFREMLVVIKELPNRRFDSADKIWDIPAETTIEVVRQRVEAAGFTLQR